MCVGCGSVSVCVWGGGGSVRGVARCVGACHCGCGRVMGVALCGGGGSFVSAYAACRVIHT